MTIVVILRQYDIFSAFSVHNFPVSEPAMAVSMTNTYKILVTIAVAETASLPTSI